MWQHYELSSVKILNALISFCNHSASLEKKLQRNCILLLKSLFVRVTLFVKHYPFFTSCIADQGAALCVFGKPSVGDRGV